MQLFPRPQVILLGHFWVQRPRIRPIWKQWSAAVQWRGDFLRLRSVQVRALWRTKSEMLRTKWNVVFRAAIQRRGSISAWTVILSMAQTQLQLISPFLPWSLDYEINYWVIKQLCWRTVCSYYVSRLDRHVTYYTSHMLYICRYLP